MFVVQLGLKEFYKASMKPLLSPEVDLAAVPHVPSMLKALKVTRVDAANPGAPCLYRAPALTAVSNNVGSSLTITVRC